MLAKKFRFSTKNFEFLRRGMKSFRWGGFLFLYGADKFHSHFSVVINKKTEKSAVKRNRFRRQMYAVFRKELFEKYEKLNLICLYKGPAIPENMDVIKKSIQAFSQFFFKKTS